eukprot:2940819-Amphidinium_carterae.2
MASLQKRPVRASNLFSTSVQSAAYVFGTAPGQLEALTPLSDLSQTVAWIGMHSGAAIPLLQVALLLPCQA